MSSIHDFHNFDYGYFEFKTLWFHFLNCFFYELKIFITSSIPIILVLQIHDLFTYNSIIGNVSALEKKTGVQIPPVLNYLLLMSFCLLLTSLTFGIFSFMILIYNSDIYFLYI